MDVKELRLEILEAINHNDLPVCVITAKDALDYVNDLDLPENAQYKNELEAHSRVKKLLQNIQDRGLWNEVVDDEVHKAANSKLYQLTVESDTGKVFFLNHWRVRRGGEFSPKGVPSNAEWRNTATMLLSEEINVVSSAIADKVCYVVKQAGWEDRKEPVSLGMLGLKDGIMMKAIIEKVQEEYPTLPISVGGFDLFDSNTVSSKAKLAELGLQVDDDLFDIGIENFGGKGNKFDIVLAHHLYHRDFLSKAMPDMMAKYNKDNAVIYTIYSGQSPIDKLKEHSDYRTWFRGDSGLGKTIAKWNESSLGCGQDSIPAKTAFSTIDLPPIDLEYISYFQTLPDADYTSVYEPCGEIDPKTGIDKRVQFANVLSFLLHVPPTALNLEQRNQFMPKLSEMIQNSGYKLSTAVETLAIPSQNSTPEFRNIVRASINAPFRGHSDNSIKFRCYEVV